MPLVTLTDSQMAVAIKEAERRTEAGRNQTSRTFTGITLTEELKQQISSKLKGRPSHKKGKKVGPQHTPESKAKIAESNRRRIYSAETRAKIAAGVKAANLRRLSN